MSVLRVLRALGYFGIAMFLALLSLPYAAIGLGFGVSGDNRSADDWLDRAPLMRFMDWREGWQRG